MYFIRKTGAALVALALLAGCDNKPDDKDQQPPHKTGSCLETIDGKACINFYKMDLIKGQSRTFTVTNPDNIEYQLHTFSPLFFKELGPNQYTVRADFETEDAVAQLRLIEPYSGIPTDDSSYSTIALLEPTERWVVMPITQAYSEAGNTIDLTYLPPINSETNALYDGSYVIHVAEIEEDGTVVREFSETTLETKHTINTQFDTLYQITLQVVNNDVTYSSEPIRARSNATDMRLVEIIEHEDLLTQTATCPPTEEAFDIGTLYACGDELYVYSLADEEEQTNGWLDATAMDLYEPGAFPQMTISVPSLEPTAMSAYLDAAEHTDSLENLPSDTLFFDGDVLYYNGITIPTMLANRDDVVAGFAGNDWEFSKTD